jgi:hypothetical protein
MIEMNTPKVVGCLVCGFRSENVIEIENFQDNGCPICTTETTSKTCLYGCPNCVDVRSVFVECREWFDRSGGNSYFSARVWVNGKWEITLPFQYGYGDHFKSVAVSALVEKGFIPKEWEHRALWVIADEMRFDLYTSKAETKKNEMFKESK